MQKSIVKRFIEKSPRRMNKNSNVVEQLYSPVQKTAVNSVSKVKTHTMKTKTGKVTLVKEHTRKINKAIKQFRNLRDESIKQALLISKKYKNKKADLKIIDDFNNQLKFGVVKLLARELGLSKDSSKLKSKAETLYGNIQSVTDAIFKNKRLNIQWTANKPEKKVFAGKSKFTYGYYGSGDVIKPKDIVIEQGNVFYNQNTSKDKNWNATLNRKGLKILQIGRQEVSGAGKFPVKMMVTLNGKLLVRNTKPMSKEEIIKIIKG